MLGGRYELGPAIGSGGFGTVFRARDRRTGGDVAVKLVLRGLGADAAADRLRREGGLLRTVASRRVARVLDHGSDESGAWLVTDLVDGGPLTSTTLGRALLPHEVLHVARALLEGIADVHRSGVIHGDVKAANVLIGPGSLESITIVDFGLARFAARSDVAAAVGEGPREGTVLGTARWMAPEVLAGGEPSPRSDLYGAGLVLFDLLDLGSLFQGDDARGELRARLVDDPGLDERVPEPLRDVLARLLARDPAQRFRDGADAHAAVTDLDTAPVSVLPPTSSRLPPSLPPLRVSSLPPGSRPPVSESRRRSRAPSMPPPRLTTLPPDGVGALKGTLQHLDLPMLDALARRERGNSLGRIARGVALAFRLELDAAALILEPLAVGSEVARAIGASLLAPRARRATRARVDGDREDRWIDAIDPELAAMLVALATALGTEADAARDESRCVRARARLVGVVGADAVRGTLAVAHTIARFRKGDLDRAAALLALPLPGDELAPFHVVVRALAAAAVAVDEADVDALLLAADTGTTLLDAAAATAAGGLFAATVPAGARALQVLERAGTLLAHGDAPSLEHAAEHHRATVLVAHGRHADAVPHFRAAREAAHAERATDLDLHSTALEAIAELAAGDRVAARETVLVLTDARLAVAAGPAAIAGWVARALVARADGDDGTVLVRAAEARLPDASTPEAVALLAAARFLLDGDVGRAATRLEGHEGAFFWLDAVAVSEPRLAALVAALTRSRRTDAPPALSAPE